jgi:acyl carrier protein
VLTLPRLPISEATADDNLLSLGGDSLQAAELSLELEREFDLEAPYEVIVGRQSIRELAAWMSSRLEQRVGGSSG